MIIFGVLGYIMKKYGYEAAPLIMALVLGPMAEEGLRISLTISHGDPLIFFYRPISAIFLILAILILCSPLILNLLGMKRPGSLKEGGDEF